MGKLVPAIAAAFVLGIVVGGLGGVGIDGIGHGGAPTPADSGPDPESPPYSLSTSGGNCLEPQPHAGWVHEVAVGDSFAVTLNATLVHDRDQTVAANVSRVSSGAYRIDLRTVTDDRGSASESREKSPPDDCRVATDLRLGASLPTDYRQFEVTANGRTLLTVENEDTTADLYQLPNPINATES